MSRAPGRTGRYPGVGKAAGVRRGFAPRGAPSRSKGGTEPPMIGACAEAGTSAPVGGARSEPTGGWVRNGYMFGHAGHGV